MATRSLLTATLSIALFCATYSWADDSQEARESGADRYLTAVPMEKMLGDAVSEIAKQVPAANREQFVTLMNGSLRIDALRRITRDTLIEVFSADELNALADFYSSVHGQSAMQKFGVYMGRILPSVQQEVMSAFEEVRGRMK